MRLTTLLRSVLRSDGEFTTLGRERELVACYLQIEQERFEERLDVRIDIPESLWSVRIPSLILQPLVENAVKHGIATAREGGSILVAASCDEHASEVELVVRNTGSPFIGRVPSNDGGIGLQSVERRLDAHYGARARVSLRSEEDGATRAVVRLPALMTPDAQATAFDRRVS
jgi:two-component system LytT family sensor kinase